MTSGISPGPGMRGACLIGGIRLRMITIFSVWLIILWCAVFGAQEDSLRSALSAVDKRQRYLNRFADDALSSYAYSDDTNLEFLGSDEKPYYKSNLYDRALLGYLQGDDLRRNDFIKRSITSPFRERVEEDREKQREQFTKYLIDSMNAENDNNGVIYGEIIDDFVDKYPNKKSHYYYTAERKRANNKHYQPESFSNAATTVYALSYLPRDDAEDANAYLTESNIFSQHKRFPVSKRSNYYDFNVLHKRSPNSKELPKKTDPKVEKELSNIFGQSSNKTKPEKGKKPKKVNSKEVAVPPVVSKAEPLDIKKKSIDWSDYFGLDRRKKSGNDDLDKEWLMERYHKAVSMTAKRSTEYPLQHFHNHDQPQNNHANQQQPEQPPVKTNKAEVKTEEAKIKEIDEKLKNIEDTIVDDALKYTGAHEDAIDSKEIQEVKDRVISRLAAAYSLEKMRRALGEYKLSVAKERGRLNKENKNAEDALFAEEKRVSVPRKQAVDEETEKQNIDDNNIKCKGDNCDLHNYKIPSRILEQFQWGIEECPKVQRECSDLASLIGKYGRAFEMACNMHQLCLLCNDNNWFAPSVRCNALYLSKANDVCYENAECLKIAQYFLENLLLLNHSTRDRDYSLDGCNLICPENER